MKINVTRPTRLNGKSIGPNKKGKPTTLDVTDAEGRALIAAGKAVKHVAKKDDVTPPDDEKTGTDGDGSQTGPVSTQNAGALVS